MHKPVRTIARRFTRLSSYLAFTCFMLISQTCNSASVTRQIELPSGDEINAAVHGHSSNQRILWIGSISGFHKRHKEVAQQLAKNGKEIWQVNLVEDLFLTRRAESMRTISPHIIAELIEALSQNGRYSLLLISSSYGSIPLIRGIHAWQELDEKKARLLGTILFTPYFYTSIPSLGEPPDMIPELSVTNTPLFIIQAQKNGNRWHLDNALNMLQMHAPVYTQFLPGVTSLFYEKDKTPQTIDTLKNLNLYIERATYLLGLHAFSQHALALKKPIGNVASSGLNTELTPYKGHVKPQPVSLNDVHDNQVEINNYTGKVTLINFWASWCPPCVEEIPSLNRLKQKMQGKPFQLISINYAEDIEQVRDFMKKVAVDFPVLIDPRGEIAGDWKVVAFPSTFVIGPDGRIRYGVNAAIHWDTDEVVSQLNKLMPR